MSAGALLRAEGIEVMWGRRRALAGVDLALEGGACLALYGPNGAGKTTLLRVLAGLLPPTRGRAWVDGRLVTEGSPRARVAIGMVGHDTFLYDGLTGRENLLFYGSLYGLGGEALRRRADELLERLGLSWQATDPVRTYSRGMAQRLAVARALLHRPRVILLDEPFTGLDAAGAGTVTQLVREAVGGGAAALVVTHDVLRGIDLASHLAILVGGRLIHQRSAAGVTPADWAAAYRMAVERGGGGAPLRQGGRR